MKMNVSMDLKPLKSLAKKSPIAFKKAMEKAAAQFLLWANDGSKNSPRKPPIRWGVLRGSSSAFVGNTLVKVSDQQIKAGATERPTPAKSHSAPATSITWVWNTEYATKMHEWSGGWGEFTERDANAGAKWLEEHLKADRNDLMEMIGKEVKNELGM